MSGNQYPWREIVLNLDRCEHGRHEGDPCSGVTGCNGPSKGNPHIKPGQVIGYLMDRSPIIMPERRELRGCPDNWVQR